MSDGSRRIADCYFYNKHTYIFVSKSGYWHPAKLKCEETGGHLAVLNDRGEYLATLSACRGTVWIGLTDEKSEGHWVWVDGTRLTFSSWAVSQPNNWSPYTGFSQDYGVLWDQVNYLWDDHEATALNGFLCEYDFLIEDPVLLVKLRDCLNGRTDATVVAQETLRTRLVRTIEKEVRGLPRGSVQVQETAGGVRISVADLNFNPDSTDLVAADRPTLTVLRRLLARFREHEVRFIGHTAQWGTIESCLDLSRRRARVMADAFTTGGTLRKEKVKIEGRGFAEPLADNATEPGRARNRRVEIIILDQ